MNPFRKQHLERVVRDGSAAYLTGACDTPPLCALCEKTRGTMMGRSFLLLPYLTSTCLLNKIRALISYKNSSAAANNCSIIIPHILFAQACRKSASTESTAHNALL
jgi:hypothetical protein